MSSRRCGGFSAGRGSAGADPMGFFLGDISWRAGRRGGGVSHSQITGGSGKRNRAGSQPGGSPFDRVEDVGRGDRFRGRAVAVSSLMLQNSRWGKPLARAMALLLLAACTPRLPRPAPTAARADPSCRADLDSTVAIVSRDYAGFADRASREAAELARRTRTARAEVAGGLDEQECTRALLRWADAFRDPHLTVAGRPSRRPAGAPGAPAPGSPGRRIELRFPDDSTAILRLPTFDLGRRAAIDSMMAEHRSRLLATPYLLIDVRQNGGGWSGSYASVLPLLYTDPIRVRGIEVWASAGNLASMRNDVGPDGVPPEVAEQIRSVVPRMEASPDRFVKLQEDAVLRLDTVYPLPRRVAVLVDRGCASACEQFVLEARQSRKVTVLGAENTRGALDYLNVRAVRLPSGYRTLRFPISRLSGLPADAVNAEGIRPEILVPPDEPDALEFARRWLRPTSPPPAAAR